MSIRVGINGFGRIGRQSLKAFLERYPRDLEVVAINDITDAQTNAHLFRYDSTYGRFAGIVEVKEPDLVIDGRRIKVFAQRDPAQIPWSEVGAQIVIESTGLFTEAEKANTHRHDTVKKVIVSAPFKGRPLIRLSRLCWVSTNRTTIRASIISFPMPPAPQTAWPRP